MKKLTPFLAAGAIAFVLLPGCTTVNTLEPAQPTAQPRTMEGKETISITATAPTPRAKDFRIKFLEPTN